MNLIAMLRITRLVVKDVVCENESKFTAKEVEEDSRPEHA